MTAAEPRVAIVLVNWKTPAQTLACIATVRQLTYANRVLVVVDNGSPDGSEAILREALPGEIILQTGENLGFAGGNNVGIRRALADGAEFIWLLNTDTLVAPDALGRMIATALTCGADLIGPLLRYGVSDAADGANDVQFDGAEINWRTGETHSFAASGQRMSYDRPYFTALLHGASMIVHRRVFDRVGLLPELYFLNYEETEFCVRAARAGFTLVVEPRAEVRHLVGASMGRNSPTYFFYMHRNQAIFMRRNASRGQQAVFFAQYVLWMLKGWVVWRARGYDRASTVFGRAMLDGLRMKGGRVAL